MDLAKLRAFSRAVKPWHVGLACGALLLFAIVLPIAGFSLLLKEQEASGQPTTLPAAQLPVPQEPATTTATATVPAEEFSFPSLPTATTQPGEPRPPAIPHLTLIEVLGNLKYLPHTEEFACTSGPTEGPETFWSCWSPGDGSPITRVVTVLGDDPGEHKLGYRHGPRAR